MAPEQYAQEFECSFESALIGSYYGSYLETAQAEERITRVPHTPSLPVHTAWDLGISDATAIWFLQPIGRMLHVIDYLEASDHGLEWYSRVLHEKPYTYGRHYFPHDIEARDFSSDGRTRLAMAEQLGLRPCRCGPPRRCGGRYPGCALDVPAASCSMREVLRGHRGAEGVPARLERDAEDLGRAPAARLVEPRRRRPALLCDGLRRGYASTPTADAAQGPALGQASVLEGGEGGGGGRTSKRPVKT